MLINEKRDEVEQSIIDLRETMTLIVLVQGYGNHLEKEYHDNLFGCLERLIDYMVAYVNAVDISFNDYVRAVEKKNIDPSMLYGQVETGCKGIKK